MNTTPRVLIEPDRIAARVRELAAEISRDYSDLGGVVVLGVLRGAFIFVGDLSRELTVECTVDFIAVASYGSGSSTDGNVRTILGLQTDLRGKHVLIVDDILDTGSTLRHLREMLADHGPASIRSCVLVRKRKARGDAFVSDDGSYVGFDIDDVWVVGYGLDYADRFRTLPYLGFIDPPDSDASPRAPETRGSSDAPRGGR